MAVTVCDSDDCSGSDSDGLKGDSDDDSPKQVPDYVRNIMKSTNCEGPLSEPDAKDGT